MTTTIIEYNRSRRQWQTRPGNTTEADALTAGRVIAFPAGKEGRRAAQLSALTNDAPEVAAEVDALIQALISRGHAQAIDRAIKAGQLVAAGKVRQPRAAAAFGSYRGEVARVESGQTPGLHYAVIWSDGSESKDPPYTGYSCECPDSSNGVKRHVLQPGDPDFPPFGAPLLSGFGYFCKHAAAAYVAELISKIDEWEAEPIPFNGEPWPVREAN